MTRYWITCDGQKIGGVAFLAPLSQGAMDRTVMDYEETLGVRGLRLERVQWHGDMWGCYAEG